MSRDVVFDENIFPFASLHPNAGARLRSEILILPKTLCGDFSCDMGLNIGMIILFLILLLIPLSRQALALLLVQILQARIAQQIPVQMTMISYYNRSVPRLATRVGASRRIFLLWLLHMRLGSRGDLPRHPCTATRVFPLLQL